MHHLTCLLAVFYLLPGALKHADASRGTSIDYKIQKRMANRRQESQRGKGSRKHVNFGLEEVEEEEEEEVEVDTSDGEEEEVEEEEEDASDGEEEVEEDGEEEEEVGEEEVEEEEEEEVEEEGTKRPSKRQKNEKSSSFFDKAPDGTRFVASSFGDLNLSRPLVRACDALGYVNPTPIQAACIPLALTGRDICGSAITGSGKTAAFALPLLERLLHRNRRVAATYVLILAPTRELAVQVHSMIEKLAQFTDIRSTLVVGGLSLQSQAAALRSYPEIVVATPGRLIDHLCNSQGFGLEDLAALVLDEADRLLEMGFTDEVKQIVRSAPTKRQTLLFSATMTEEVKDLIALSLKHPVRLAADAISAAPATLRQEVVRLRGAAVTGKEAILLALASRKGKDGEKGEKGSNPCQGRTIVFFSTKQKAHRAKILFGLSGLPPAAELHGDMSQAARLESLENFRRGEVGFLLATDVAARGLDILGVSTVINYDCPKTLASYLHRIGRTARAGSSGLAITFVDDDDRGLVKQVVKRAGVELQQRKVATSVVERWQRTIEGLEGDVSKILAEEREEKEIRKAEMEATKAANMLEHEAEIFARPARTWFQSQSQKKAAASSSAHSGDGDKKRDTDDAIQKKIDKNAAKSSRRMQRKLNAEGAEKNSSSSSKNGMMKRDPKVRAVKSRQAALREQGISASKASKIASAMVGTTSKREGGGGVTKKAHNDQPSRPQVAGSARVYSGGAKSRTPKKAPDNKGAATGRLKRGGKGKNAFKSKARHKRRR